MGKFLRSEYQAEGQRQRVQRSGRLTDLAAVTDDRQAAADAAEEKRYKQKAAQYKANKPAKRNRECTAGKGNLGFAMFWLIWAWSETLAWLK